MKLIRHLTFIKNITVSANDLYNYKTCNAWHGKRRRSLFVFRCHDMTDIRMSQSRGFMKINLLHRLQIFYSKRGGYGWLSSKP